MARRVLMQRGVDSFDLVEVPAPNEHVLQDVMKANPQLVPSDDLGLDGDLLVVGRETALASGKIDLLCVTRSGDVVLIEFKTGPQNPDFRHALAQVIDYGSDLWRMSLDDFDRGVVQRYLASSHCDALFKGSGDLSGAIARTGWAMTDSEHSAFLRRLTEVLELGDFTYVVAAQRFTAAMSTSLAYLNATMRRGRFFLVEIVRLEGKDLVAHAAQVVAAPAARSGSGGSSAASQANEADFLEHISDDTYREAMKDIFASCGSLGLTVYWGSKGSSIRLPTSDRPEPLSVGWAFLEGDQWNGARYLTLGVDQTSLQQTPSVVAAVTGFVHTISGIPGAQPVPTKLDAYTFAPAFVPGAKEAIISALEALVETKQESGEHPD